MFGEKNKHDDIYDDFKKFCTVNDFDIFYAYGSALTYAALVESRITNNLLLIGNTELCERLGLDIDNLYAEIEHLAVIRQKISFDKSKDNARGSK